MFGVLVLIPIAIYPAYLSLGGDPSIADYLRAYVGLPFLPNGQLWFLWQLLALNFVLVAIYLIAPAAISALARWCAKAGKRPGVFFAVLVAVSAVAYVPLALIFTPWGVVEFRESCRCNGAGRCSMACIFSPELASAPPASMSAWWTLMVRSVGAGNCGLWSPSAPCCCGWA